MQSSAGVQLAASVVFLNIIAAFPDEIVAVFRR